MRVTSGFHERACKRPLWCNPVTEPICKTDRATRCRTACRAVRLPVVTVSADVLLLAWQVAAHDGRNRRSWFPVRCSPAWRDDSVTARLLTSIGRLWTGSEIISNPALLTSDHRISWVG